jgi:cytochrome c oxidase subunit 3
MNKAEKTGSEKAEQELSGNGHARPQERPFSEARLGMWLGIAALSMVFAALCVAYVVRLHDRLNFYFEPPKSLWISTVLLVSSSIVLHFGVDAIRTGHGKRFRKLMGVTVALGWGFLVSQFVAWLELMHQGVYAQTNPFSGFFYIFTFVHAAHLIVGIAWITYIFRASGSGVFTVHKHLAVDLGALYWHFVDIAWMALFILIMFF